MSRGARALAFALFAVACALASVALVARADRSDPVYGDLQPVLVTTMALSPGDELGERRLRRLETREVPAAYVPPDAFRAPDQVEGASVRARVPPGSYLLAAHLGSPEPAARASAVGPGRVPIDVEVAAAGAIARGPSVDLVDVIVARETLSPGKRGVSTVARRARLLALQPVRNRISGDGPRWLATLALPREDAVATVEAENFAREVRLLPR